MIRDYFTNTVEDAAEFERVHGGRFAHDPDVPTPAELAEDRELKRRERASARRLEDQGADEP